MAPFPALEHHNPHPNQRRADGEDSKGRQDAHGVVDQLPAEAQGDAAVQLKGDMVCNYGRLQASVISFVSRGV